MSLLLHYDTNTTISQLQEHWDKLKRSTETIEASIDDSKEAME